VSNTVFTNVQIDSNRVSDVAVGSYILYFDDTVASFNDVEITSNSAGINVFLLGSVVYASNTQVNQNTVQYGGAFYLSTQSTLIASDCGFISNSASEFGGAIYNYGGTVNLDDSTITGNTAYTAGAAYCAPGSSFIQTSCTIDDNTSLDGSDPLQCSQ